VRSANRSPPHIQNAVIRPEARTCRRSGETRCYFANRSPKTCQAPNHRNPRQSSTSACPMSSTQTSILDIEHRAGFIEHRRVGSVQQPNSFTIYILQVTLLQSYFADSDPRQALENKYLRARYPRGRGVYARNQQENTLKPVTPRSTEPTMATKGWHTTRQLPAFGPLRAPCHGQSRAISRAVLDTPPLPLAFTIPRGLFVPASAGHLGLPPQPIPRRPNGYREYCLPSATVSPTPVTVLDLVYLRQDTPFRSHPAFRRWP